MYFLKIILLVLDVDNKFHVLIVISVMLLYQLKNSWKYLEFGILFFFVPKTNESFLLWRYFACEFASISFLSDMHSFIFKQKEISKFSFFFKTLIVQN